jgi:hypothetical protein
VNASDLEKKAEKALLFLHEKAAEHAEARAQADHMDDWLKVELARIKHTMGFADSDAAKTAAAMRSEDYQKALEVAKTAKEVWFTVQFKREAANAFIQAWQTASANERRGV